MPENVHSELLDVEENKKVFNVLGPRKVSLSTAVVQVYLAQPDKNKWRKHVTGVACFVKDFTVKSFFIKVIDIKTESIVWEEELYKEFQYSAPCNFFITFEAKDCRAGLNFASEDEATKFKIEVDKKIEKEHSRRESRQIRRCKAEQPEKSFKLEHPTPPNTSTHSAQRTTKTGITRNKKKKLTKADISDPSNFVHLSHGGWDPNKGFDQLDDTDMDMKSLLRKVGITCADQCDKDMVEFIYDFIDKNGGREQLRKELSEDDTNKKKQGMQHHTTDKKNKKAPTKPNFAPPTPPQNICIPNDNQKKRKAPQRPGINAPPPPPAPSPNNTHLSDMPLPPPPPSTDLIMTNDVLLPPPPPPAYIPQTSSPGAPPSPAPPLPSAVPPPPAPPPPPPPPPSSGIPPAPIPSTGPKQPPSNGSGRGDLLASIRAGKVLNKVQTTSARTESISNSGGIVGSLALALANRQKHIQGNDEDYSDDSIDSDDDWDED